MPEKEKMDYGILERDWLDEEELEVEAARKTNEQRLNFAVYSTLLIQ